MNRSRKKAQKAQKIIRGKEGLFPGEMPGFGLRLVLFCGCGF
jgi:hypothetical protein